MQIGNESPPPTTRIEGECQAKISLTAPGGRATAVPTIKRGREVIVEKRIKSPEKKKAGAPRKKGSRDLDFP